MDTKPDIQLLAAYEIVNTQETIRRAASDGEKVAKAFSLPLGRISGKASEFQKSMEAASARVVAFGAVAGQIYAVKLAFEKLTSSTIQVEKELANINLYLSLSSAGLKNFSSNLFAIATKTAQPFSDAAKAAQEFARQGLTTNEVLKRTNDALSLTRLTGMSMEESITDLTSIMNSFGKESLNTTMIVDRLSSVGGKFAVSADAIAEALKRVGSSANDAGVHFDDMVALITSAQHITGRSATVIGNSFKTIFTRLERPKVLEDLEAVGVQVRNTSGQMLPLVDIIRNLSQRYETLSTSQKSFISETVGGVFQINTLKAVMNDLGSGFSIYDSAVKAASNSTGIAQKRIEELNQTISSQLQQSATIWQQTLSNIGNLSVASPLKGGIKLAGTIGQQSGELTNPNNNSGTATAFQGAIKGISNVLSGPGLQVGISLLYKLFDKLVTFSYQAYKDISGISQVTKQRAEIERSIVSELSNENSQLHKIMESNISVEEKNKQILQLIKEQISAQEKLRANTSAVANSLEAQGIAGSFHTATSGRNIPNLALPDSIQNALKRENHATHGNARLSSHPSLITDQNPLGLVAIDGRTQKNAAQAINQHLSLGQSINDIRYGNTSKVPSLAINDSSLLITTLMGMGKGISSTNDMEYIMLKLKNMFGQLSDATEKQLYTTYKLNDVQNDLLKGKSVGSFTLPGSSSASPEKTYNIINHGEFKKIFSDKLKNESGETLQTQVDKLKENNRKEESKSQNSGFKLAIASDVAGGFWSEALKNSSPNASRGSEKLFQDLSLAGQAKMFLPGPQGNTLAAGLAGVGIANFFKELQDKIAGSEQAFDKQKDTVEKVNSSIDALVQSISNLDNMALDSSVTFEALNREQRKFEEALDSFSGSGISQNQITAIRTAPDSKSKIRALEEIRESKGNELDNSALNLDLQKTISQKQGLLSFIPGMGELGLKARGGIFGYSNDAEKDEQVNRINSIASQALANMSDSQKSAFEDRVMNSNNEYESNQSKINISDLYGQKNDTLKNLLSQGTPQDQSLIIEQAKYLATQSAIQKNPEAKDAINQARLNAQEARLPLDLKTRQLEAQKRVYVNSTDLNIDYSLQRSKIGSQLGFSKKESQLNLEEGYSSVLGMTAGNKTMITYQQNIEAEKARLESQEKISQAGFGFSQKMFAGYAQNTEPIIKEALNNGQLASLGEQSIAIPEYQAQIDKALNQGLSKTVDQNNGNVSKFIGSNGQFDFTSFNDAILKNSGTGGNEKLYNVLQNILETNQGSVEQLKNIEDYSDQVVNLNIEGNQVVKEASNKYENALKQYQIQMNSSTLGGIKAFENPGEGMKLMGEYVRNQAMANSSNPVIQGRGAIGMLEWMKNNSGQDVTFGTPQQNGLYDEKSGSKLVNEQSHYANQFLKGYYQQQQTMLSRMNPNDPLAVAMKQNIKTQGYGIGKDALETLIHPEKNTSTATATDISDKFKLALDSTQQPINNFSSSLDTLVAKINSINNEIEKGTPASTWKMNGVTFTNPGTESLRKSVQNQIDTQNKKIKDIENSLAQGGTPNSTTSQQQAKGGSKSGLSGTLADIGDYVGSAGLIGGSLLLARKKIPQSYRNLKGRITGESFIGPKIPKYFENSDSGYTKGNVSTKGYNKNIEEYKQFKSEDIRLNEEENAQFLEQQEALKAKNYINEQLSSQHKQLGNIKSPLQIAEHASVGSPTRFEDVRQTQVDLLNNARQKLANGNLSSNEFEKTRSEVIKLEEQTKLLNAPSYEPNFTQPGINPLSHSALEVGEGGLMKVRKGNEIQIRNKIYKGNQNIPMNVQSHEIIPNLIITPKSGETSGRIPAIGESTDDFIKRFSKSSGKLGKLGVFAGLAALTYGAFKGTSASAETLNDKNNNSDIISSTLDTTNSGVTTANLGIDAITHLGTVSKFLNPLSKVSKIPGVGLLSKVSTPLNIGIGAYSTFKDLKKGDYLNAGLDIAETASSLNPFTMAANIGSKAAGFGGTWLGQHSDAAERANTIGQLSNQKYNELMENNYPLQRIQQLRGSISNIQYQEGVTRADKGLTPEQKDKRIDSSEKAIQQLTASIESLRNEYAKVNSTTTEGTTGSNNGTGAEIPLNITISLDNLDKAPDILQQKIIKPLINQLNLLSNDVLALKRQMGMNPSAARIS